MKAIHTYVAFVVVTAIAATPFLDWGQLQLLTGSQWLGFGSLLVLALFAESLALRITIERTSVGSSITFLPILTSVVLFGPLAGTLCAVVAGGLGESILRRKPPLRVVFNLAQWTLATFLAGLLFTAVGGHGVVLGTVVENGLILTTQFGPLLLYAVAFVLLNHLAVSVAIALDAQASFLHVWTTLVGRSASNILYDVLISPIAIAVAFFYVALGLIGVLVAVLPLLFIRHSYFTSLRLQQANKDLLRALVKAIETRDPYTSGHSLRVSSLAKRIAEGMGLPGRRVSEVETAALLHDIGKIDAVYVDILKKPGHLTSEEQEMIQSHVTKGVELLESLSSFGERVIRAVRHHHERIDGKGYPDGLCGEDIPLGGRIIKVCDAVDAMLSDRPYRKALDLSVVRDQLRSYSGTQFDRNIVRQVIASTILEEHESSVRRARLRSPEVYLESYSSRRAVGQR